MAIIMEKKDDRRLVRNSAGSAVAKGKRGIKKKGASRTLFTPRRLSLKVVLWAGISHERDLSAGNIQKCARLLARGLENLMRPCPRLFVEVICTYRIPSVHSCTPEGWYRVFRR
jgi:hypothetical protein